MTKNSIYKTKLNDFVMGELSKNEQEAIQAHHNECSKYSANINVLQ